MPPPPLKYLGPALRRARRLRGLTQREVSERTGLTRAMISGYERGRLNPLVRSLWKLLEALGATLTDLETLMQERQAEREPERALAPWWSEENESV